jgi:hypothetical protein
MEIPKEEHPKQIKCYCGHTTYCDCNPKEEPTCWDCKGTISKEGICLCNREEPKQELPIVNGSYGCTIQTKKQETLEEAAENYINLNKRFADTGKAFITGAKWMQERTYNEEDLIQLLNFVSKEYNISNGIGYFHTHESFEDVTSKEVFNKWFEQFKKK